MTPEQQSSQSHQVADYIVDLNNEGLSFFLRGDYDRAIAQLRLAFDTFSANQQQQRTPGFQSTTAQEAQTPILTPNPQKNENGIGNSRLHQPSLSFLQQHEQAEAPHQPLHYESEQHLPLMMDCDVDKIVREKAARCFQIEPTSSYASSPNSACSMYNRALVLSKDQDDYTMMVTFRHRTAAIILYNLALVHHNIGVHCGVSTALEHALRLYEMSLSMVVQKEGSSSSPASSLPPPPFFADISKLLLALYNNLTNIHTALFHFQPTQQCLQSLRVVLAATCASTIMDDDDYAFFFLNALFQEKELGFAPAA